MRIWFIVNNNRYDVAVHFWYSLYPRPPPVILTSMLLHICNKYFKKKWYIKQTIVVYMPRRQETTELQAFRFDSRDCKSFRASCTAHESLFIRIRKMDLPDIMNHNTYDRSQIYVRADKTEALQVQPGESIHIKIKQQDFHFEVLSIHVLTSINQRPWFVRTAVLSGSFT